MTARKVEDIDYRLLRTDQRKTADVVIERDGGVSVRVPNHLSDEQADQVVHRKRVWIYKSLAEWRDMNASRIVRRWVNGEGFLYVGSSYRLLLVADQKEDLLLKNGRFCLRRTIVDKGGEQAARDAFEAFYIKRGQERIAQRVNYYAPKVGRAPVSVTVKELGYRWASCSKDGKLAFHWKCMMAQPKVIDYIVLHELCHLHHRDHTDAFWNEVDKVMPDYRERKEWLRRNGAGMDL